MTKAPPSNDSKYDRKSNNASDYYTPLSDSRKYYAANSDIPNYSSRNSNIQPPTLSLEYSDFESSTLNTDKAGETNHVIKQYYLKEKYNFNITEQNPFTKNTRFVGTSDPHAIYAQFYLSLLKNTK